MQRNATQEDISTGEVLKLTGIFTIIVSVAVGLLCLFVLPTSCSIVGGFSVILAGMFLILGIVAYAVGTIMIRRNN